MSDWKQGMKSQGRGLYVRVDELHVDVPEACAENRWELDEEHTAHVITAAVQLAIHCKARRPATTLTLYGIAPEPKRIPL